MNKRLRETISTPEKRGVDYYERDVIKINQPGGAKKVVIDT
jgi:hypothetical protein